MAHPAPRGLGEARPHSRTGREYAQRVFPAVRAWARHPSPPLVDAGLALLLGVPVVAAASHAPARWGVIFGVLVAAPVAFRRRSPLIALAVIVGAAMASPVSLPFQLGLVVVLYTIGSRRGWEQTIRH